MVALSYVISCSKARVIFQDDSTNITIVKLSYKEFFTQHVIGFVGHQLNLRKTICSAYGKRMLSKDSIAKIQVQKYLRFYVSR